MKIFNNRDEWLKGRGHTIGGSDASAVVGMNPYKTNEQLWLEKTGQVVPADI
jgi:predicted phage-related endonuclease